MTAPLFSIRDADVVRAGRTILHVGEFDLAEGEHVAILGDRSFVTETIYYDAESGTATPRTDAPVDAAAVERLNTYVKNKFTVATEMLYTDYFAKVRDRTAAD